MKEEHKGTKSNLPEEAIGQESAEEQTDETEEKIKDTAEEIPEEKSERGNRLSI